MAIDKKMVSDIHVVCYETDVACALKPAAFLNYAQEIAGASADRLGFGQNLLGPINQAWVLSRMKVDFLEYPHWRDDVRLTSWHRGLDGLFYVRDFELTDQSGKTIIMATSSWVILDLAERKIVRSCEGMNEDTVCTETVYRDAADHKDTVCQRLRPSKSVVLEPCAEHKVCYSDIDKNGHTNNVQYTVWAMDTFPMEFHKENHVRTLEINFNREALPGETVVLCKGQDPDDPKVWWIEGTVEGQQSFILKLTF